MSRGEIKIKDLAANSESVAVEFKRARGVTAAQTRPSVSSDFYCLIREGGDKSGKRIVKKAES